MSDAAAFHYETRLNILHGPLEIVDAKALGDACEFHQHNRIPFLVRKCFV